MFGVRATSPVSSYDIQSNLKSNISEAIRKNIQKPDCGWAQTGGPQVGSLTLNFINPGQALPDFEITLPFPVSRLWLASIANGSKNNSYMFHFRPIGNTYNSNAVVPSGSEPWIPFRGFTDPTYNNLLRFKKPITQFYVDVGFEGGGGSHLTTFMFSDDSFDVEFFPGLAPSQ